MARISFIEPVPPGHHVYDSALLPRLGLPLMGAVLTRAGHDVRCYCEAIEPIDVEECLGADLVGISSTTSTQPYAYRLADEFEAAGLPVVLGGPHVTFLADEALEHASFVVRGEGEGTIAELVDALERDRPLDEIAGLSWRDAHGDPRHNPDRTRCNQSQFEALPAPDLSLIAGNERMATKPVMTQWGCPYDCEFCSVTAMFSRRVRYRRTDQVVAELTDLGAERIFFHDDNFVVSKSRTRELLRAMISRDASPDWYAQMRAQTVFRSGVEREPDHDFLGLMKDAGCRMVMVGFESASDASLEQMNKKMEVRDIVDSVRLFHEHDILVHGMFIVGTDTDDADQADRTAEFARRVGIDTFQLMIETPLPGTRLFARAEAENRFLTDDWSLFDGHHAVMRPARMHPHELQVSTLKAMERFYSRAAILWPSISNAVRHAPSLTRVAIRNRLLDRRLPTLSRLALRRRWQELIDSVQVALPKADWSRFEQAFAVPAMRAYGRSQVAKWWQQDRSRAHLEFLAGL